MFEGVLFHFLKRSGFGVDWVLGAESLLPYLPGMVL